jgi:hypothetical protein
MSNISFSILNAVVDRTGRQEIKKCVRGNEFENEIRNKFILFYNCKCL